ncbi:hypothetical protein Lalb_Chr07g0181361 [Lupinus albus]|uniref:Uncharacterized protein n=1 Tax=Lupinus albus TaxID=3870 RepID=A0A6A4Q8M9_LUPAL|nr:hypothetical protein Lalb_Chr07g0181361 [Lupinus albus]
MFPLISVKSCHVYHPFSFSPTFNFNNLSHHSHSHLTPSPSSHFSLTFNTSSLSHSISSSK